MLKKLILILVVVVIAGFTFLDTKFLKRYYMIYFTTDSMFVSEDNDSFDRGPGEGTNFPAIRAIYNGTEITDLQQLAGSAGTVFIINRSLEWCPYCMRQAIELQAKYADFKAADINLVMMTYDAPELQNVFIERHSIEYPVLSDVAAQSFAALGVLRDDIKVDTKNYGLPYPGMIVIDNQGIVKGKLFIEAYSTRVATDSVLQLSKQWLSLN